MSSDRPKRSITPYAPFEDPSPATESAPAPRPSSSPPSFTQEIRNELDRIEQSITENVRRALQRLGTIVIEKQDETLREVQRAHARMDAHARELGALRATLERGATLPPPPEDL